MQIPSRRTESVPALASENTRRCDGARATPTGVLLLRPGGLEGLDEEITDDVYTIRGEDLADLRQDRALLPLGVLRGPPAAELAAHEARQSMCLAVIEARVADHGDRARERLCEAAVALVQPKCPPERDDVFRVEPVARAVRHGRLGWWERRAEGYCFVYRRGDRDDDFAGSKCLGVVALRRH